MNHWGRIPIPSLFKKSKSPFGITKGEWKEYHGKHYENYWICIEISGGQELSTSVDSSFSLWSLILKSVQSLTMGNI